MRLACLWLILGATWPGAVAADEPPNIILCMTDDQGWGDVSYNGLKAVQTPHLDAMAAAGLRFNRFYSAAPVCSPTRGSVLTGRHPNRFGCFLYGYPIRKEERTLAQAVKAAGYVTGHFGKWHLNGVSGPGKPVLADDPLSPGRVGFDEWLSASNFFDLNPSLGRNGVPESFKGDGSDIIVDEALKFIGRAIENKKRFFTVVWFGNPHSPHQALPEDRERAGGSEYYGELVGVDRAMGRLRSELRKRGAADDTLVWFCSDNGAIPAGSAGGLRGKKSTVWEGGIRVPGLVEWPARIKPAVTELPAVTSDIYPTIVDLLGLQVPKQVEPIDGISLRPLLEGKPFESRPKPIGFWHFPGGKKGLEKAGGQAALVDNQFKLHKLTAERYELYDLVRDPVESRDLLAEKPEVTAAMKGVLDAWQESVLRSFRGEDYR